MRIRGWGRSFRVIKFRADCLKHSETAGDPLRLCGLVQIPLAPSSVKLRGIMCWTTSGLRFDNDSDQRFMSIREPLEMRLCLPSD